MTDFLLRTPDTDPRMIKREINLCKFLFPQYKYSWHALNGYKKYEILALVNMAETVWLLYCAASFRAVLIEAVVLRKIELVQVSLKIYTQSVITTISSNVVSAILVYATMILAMMLERANFFYKNSLSSQDNMKLFIIVVLLPNLNQDKCLLL